MERGKTNVIFIGVWGDLEGRGKLWGKSEKGSVVKLNWEGHRIKIWIGLGFKWGGLSSDTLIDFFTHVTRA